MIILENNLYIKKIINVWYNGVGGEVLYAIWKSSNPAGVKPNIRLESGLEKKENNVLIPMGGFWGLARKDEN